MPTTYNPHPNPDCDPHPGRDYTTDCEKPPGLPTTTSGRPVTTATAPLPTGRHHQHCGGGGSGCAPLWHQEEGCPGPAACQWSWQAPPPSGKGAPWPPITVPPPTGLGLPWGARFPGSGSSLPLSGCTRPQEIPQARFPPEPRCTRGPGLLPVRGHPGSPTTFPIIQCRWPAVPTWHQLLRCYVLFIYVRQLADRISVPGKLEQIFSRQW